MSAYESVFTATTPSPIGDLSIGADSVGNLVHLTMEGTHRNQRSDDVLPVTDAARGTMEATAAQIDEYFRGSRTTFDIPLRPAGTPFQLSVWEALTVIPFGETASYGQIARAIGRPTASRAVGHSTARNPIAIIVPCHRVIGSSGTLTGYAGGLDRKRLLLDLEASVLSRGSRRSA